jgi:hypothetical protein
MIAYLRNEPGAGKVATALADPENECVAHAVNLCEVFYDFHGAEGPSIAAEAVSDLAKAGIAATDFPRWKHAGCPHIPPHSPPNGWRRV